MNETNYLFFDVETTGIKAEYNHIVQLAAILTDGSGKELETMNRIIKPEGFLIPASSTKIHGISQEKALIDGVNLRVAINEFLDMVAKTNILVAHNFLFDFSFIAKELDNDNQIDAGHSVGFYEKKNVCTMQTTTNFVKTGWSDYHQSYKWPRLEELHTKLFGVSFEGAHDALIDVRATVRCFFELKQKHGFYIPGTSETGGGYSNRNAAS